MKLSDELIGKTVGTADEQDIQSFHRLSPSAVCSAAIPVCLILKGAYRKRKIMSKPLSRELYAAMPAIKGNTAPIVLYYRTIAENYCRKLSILWARLYRLPQSRQPSILFRASQKNHRIFQNTSGWRRCFFARQNGKNPCLPALPKRQTPQTNGRFACSVLAKFLFCL